MSVGSKIAVNVAFPDTVIVLCADVTPSFHPTKEYPSFGVAEIVIVLPDVYVPVPLKEPHPGVSEDTVIVYFEEGFGSGLPFFH